MNALTPRPTFVRTVLQTLASGTSVLLVGLPGSGRSTVLAGAQAEADDDGWTVVTLRGTGTGDSGGAGERPLEALVLAGLTTGPTGTLGALAAALEGVTVAAGGARRSSADRRVLVVVDDADLLDDASASVVATVVARTGARVLASARPPASGASVARLLAGPDSTVLNMPALPFDELHRTVTEILRADVDPDTAGRLYALSGGMPGLTRAIAREARRSADLAEPGRHPGAEHWSWTPGWAVVVDRLLAGLDDSARDGLRTLAAVGPAPTAEVRRLVPWSVVETLDDHGLLRMVEDDGEVLVALFPPMLTEHLLHLAQDARGLRVAETISETFAGSARELGSRRRPRTTPSWSSSPESAAILGRRLEDRASAHLLVAHDTWERDPTVHSTVLYLDALLASHAEVDVIEDAVGVALRRLRPAAHEHRGFVVAWHAVYRAHVLHDVSGAYARLAELDADDDPRVRATSDAVRQHLRLTTGDPQAPAPAEATAPAPAPLPPPADLPDDTGRPTNALVRLVRGEVLLARGLPVDAHAELVGGVLPAHAPRHDAISLVDQAVLLSGDIDTATRSAMRSLGEARGTLAQGEIEPHGYVVALGLYVAGRLTTLREHLTSLFALGSPAPLRTTTRAGLLSLSVSLALLEGNLASARSSLARLEEMDLAAMFTPAARPGSRRAALDVATGADPRQATREAWDDVAALVERGAVLAAVTDGTTLVDLWVDEERATALADLTLTSQGAVLPALGRYLRAAADGAPDGLLVAAADLRSHGLVLHATSAHARAVTLLSREGPTARATEERARLRAAVEQAGEELSLVVPSLAPALSLTGRELEVARLVAEGLSNREVADRLVVSERTVDNHVYRIFRKLGIRSRNEVAALL
ncbi:LuxR C-terminal-related transcriptional regulator [Sanguibacter sp. 4.1]|uniref:LuxR C-terminal-related transcriptional regulator n=1 Tax=Sanguibacter biliveldensis TaxID=3030830 RepID=A0AAF1C148_9MICO|nr:LuxR C-terminal-related transcriptional regulator [Sanguibacter sp. 4.1]WPF80675.1 LuxR C-terminal-related transcriptional regulator [Sanguibacter sp. 4.1]